MHKATQAEMQVFGMLYKAGHVRKDLKLRLWRMDGAKVSYYKLGELEPKGDQLYVAHAVAHTGCLALQSGRLTIYSFLGFFMVHTIKGCRQFDFANQRSKSAAAMKLIGMDEQTLATSSIDNSVKKVRQPVCIASVIMAATNDTGRTAQFSLQVELFTGRTYTICAPDENSMHVWLDAL